MIPSKLKKGDGVRVIAPARSLSMPWIDDELKALAQRRLEELGLVVTFGNHVNERDDFDSSSIQRRIEDLHEAFSDDSVQLILTVIGGYNSNQLLRYIDYDLIHKHPKILCGYSDITALATALYAKTGMVTYSGPHFFSFGQKRNFEYTMDHFRKCLFEDAPISLRPSKEFVDERWATKQDEVQLTANEGWHVLQPGNAQGTIIGGNLSTLHLLHGTEYMPNPAGDVILFIEDDYEDHAAIFDRNLQSLLHQNLAEKVRGVLVGRMESKSGITPALLQKILTTKMELRDIPIITGLDFGHTTPMFTFPIGGTATMSAGAQPTVTIDQH